LDPHATRALLAIRIAYPTLPTNDPHFPASISAPPALPAELSWEGRRVPTGQWITLLPRELRWQDVGDIAEFNESRPVPTIQQPATAPLLMP